MKKAEKLKSVVGLDVNKLKINGVGEFSKPIFPNNPSKIDIDKNTNYSNSQTTRTVDYQSGSAVESSDLVVVSNFDNASPGPVGLGI